VPDYVEADHHKMTAKLARVPTITEVPYPVQMEPHLVVEYYSRSAEHCLRICPKIFAPESVSSPAEAGDPVAT